MHKSAVASARGSHDPAEGVGLLLANGGGGRTMQLPCWEAMHPCSLPKPRVCLGEILPPRIPSADQDGRGCGLSGGSERRSPIRVAN